jgi:DNA-directed RNA polymerase subunit omega
MARVTVEDCTKIIPKFELVLVAAQRVKEISAGSPITVSRDNDKNTVIALREIAARHLDVDAVKENIIKRYQRVHKTEIVDTPDEFDLSEMMSQEALTAASMDKDSEFEEMLDDSMSEVLGEDGDMDE